MPLRITIAVFCLSLMALPFAGQTTPPNDEKNRLVVAIPSPVESLDPTNYRTRITQVVLKNIFDSLTTRDAGMKVVPQLAESWRVLNDNTWEFKLRRGVKFHNGDTLTAKDVKFTLERVIRAGALDGKTSPRKGLLGPVSGVKIINDYTVHIETEKPWPILPLMLSLQEIIPSQYVRAVGSREFQRHPIGTGPFKFVRNEGRETLILERFTDYYGGSPDKPPVQIAPLKYLVFKTVPDMSARIAMLKKGECDIIYHVRPEAIPILKAAAGIGVLSCPATRSYFAEINCSKPPFNDVRVRHALNYAVNIRAVVSYILQGNGEVLPTVLLTNAFAYNSSLKPYAHDPGLARKLLSASSLPQGLIITINCIRNDRRFANIISASVTKLGLKSVIHIADSYKPKTLGKTAGWDIFVGSWGNSTLDPVGILAPKFKIGGRGNFLNYSNIEGDEVI